MIEEQVDVEVLLAHAHVHLPPDEGEAHAELQQEALDVGDEARFELPLLRVARERQEVEDVRVLERLPRGRTAAPGASGGSW